jgi:putative membrane protein
MADVAHDTSTSLAQTRTTLAGDRTKLAGTRTDLAGSRTGLALSRTLLAFDRTLMAWVRTATSLISFGFTIYKFFQYVRENRTGPEFETLLGPRGVALVMIGFGVGALVLATLEYRNQVTALRRKYHQYGPFHRSLAAAVAGSVSALGVLGFVLVFLRQ